MAKKCSEKKGEEAVGHESCNLAASILLLRSRVCASVFEQEGCKVFVCFCQALSRCNNHSAAGSFRL